MSKSPAHPLTLGGLLALVLGLTTGWFFLFFQSNGPTFEDAAMLMRYADHLADGHGIVWNVGGEPVDGATDFLFMVVVALLHQLGLELLTAVRLLTLAAHLATVSMVFLALVRRPVPVWMAAGVALVVGTGPALVHIEAYFGTPFFAVWGLAAFLYYLKILDGWPTRREGLWFGLFALLMALTRPEGNFLAGAMWLGIVMEWGWKTARPVTIAFWTWFGTIGLAYFAWHWWYFGHPLPNPFYIKGGGSLHWSSLRAAVQNTVKMALPLLPVFILVGLKGKWRNAAAFRKVFPLLAFILVWLLMSNAMNYGMRFQYVLFPMLAVVWAVWFDPEKWKTWRGQAAGGVVLVFLWALGTHYFFYAHDLRMPEDGRVALGKDLAPFARKGYSMAVTEAGNLPFYSGWITLDTWGLNDAHIAHRGLTTDYLDHYAPELILVHAYWSPGQDRKIHLPAWAAMNDVIFAYVEQRNYEMVACYGDDPQSTHIYYLKPDFPDRDFIRWRIRDGGYTWYETGEPAQDFLKTPN